MKLSLVTLATLALSGALAGAAAGQELTDAQLRALFESQIKDIGAARQSEDLGASRGLVLTPVAPAGAEAAPVVVEPAPEVAKPEVAASAGSTVPAATLRLDTPEATPAAAPAGAVQHWTLPRSEQVNYQVKFSFDSAALSPDQKPRLRQICAVLKEADIKEFRIIGHTDASGAADYNQKLSVLRAEEVERFFVNDCGIAAGRLQAIGVGEQFPYDDKEPEAAVNRRVEFQALS